MIRALVVAIGLLLGAISGAAAQSSVALWCWNPTGSNAGGNQYLPCRADNPLVVSATFSPSGTQNVNLTQILGAPPSLTNPLWVFPATGATFPVSAASLPLPTGAATSANQATEITALGTINTTLGTPFQAGGTVTANIGTDPTQAPVAPGAATATKANLTACQATSAAVNPTTGQQGAVNCDLNNNLLVSPGGAPNLTTAQVSIATSNTVAVAARALRRNVTITNITGTQQIYCSGTTATTGNGQLIPAVVGASWNTSTTAAINCIAVTGAQTVSVAEIY